MPQLKDRLQNLTAKLRKRQYVIPESVSRVTRTQGAAKRVSEEIKAEKEKSGPTP